MAWPGVTLADFGEYRSHTQVGQALVILSDIGEMHITAIDDAAFEVHYRETGVRQLPSFALAGDPDPVTTTLQDIGDTIEFSVDGLTALVSKSPLRVSFLKDGSELVAEEQGYYLHETARGFRFGLDDGEKILGGGQRVLGMDRRGKRMPLYNKAHYEYSTESEQMYYSLPAIMSSDRYMIVFDNSASGWLDIGATDEDVLEFQAVAGRTSYLVIAGDTYPQLVGNYTDVTGRQPLPPRWTFGNFASRFGYHTEEETRDVVRRFKRQAIPLDAVILDLYWYGPDIKGHVGNLEWDRSAFPTPEDMIADFAQQGVRTVAVTQPFMLSTSKRWQEAVDNEVLAKNAKGEPYRFDFYFGNTGLIDVFDEHARQWFWQAYERLFKQGMAGTWGDLGEPEVHPDDIQHWLSDIGLPARGDAVHNAFGHTWAKMVYERQIETFPEMRPVLLMRSGFAGSQRYGMIPWTGDVSRSWGGLKPQIELNLQMSLFGLAYTHSDLGGFAEGKEFDKELYIRWLQYGVFHPLFRPHGQEHIPSEPVFHDRETRDIARDMIRLRYRLLPYNYTLAYENSTTGLPLARPLFFEDESNPELIDEKDAYLWGNAFLVAPVMDPGVDAVDVSLPAGAWFDFWNGKRYEGNQSVSVPVTLETIPVLVRGGSFVPMVDVVETTMKYSSENLTLHYYADASVIRSQGHMYEDDGESRSSLADGQYELLYFTADRSDHTLAIAMHRDGDGYEGMPAERELTFVVHNWTAEVSSLHIGDVEIPLNRTLPRRGNGASYDSDARQLTVRLKWDHMPAELRIE
jgi:oligosaccharide 4-alpha-D-glucosyltransferase